MNASDPNRVIGSCWACGGPVRRRDVVRIYDETVGVYRKVHRGTCENTARSKLAPPGHIEGMVDP